MRVIDGLIKDTFINNEMMRVVKEKCPYKGVSGTREQKHQCHPIVTMFVNARTRVYQVLENKNINVILKLRCL